MQEGTLVLPSVVVADDLALEPGATGPKQEQTSGAPRGDTATDSELSDEPLGDDAIVDDEPVSKAAEAAPTIEQAKYAKASRTPARTHGEARAADAASETRMNSKDAITPEQALQHDEVERTRVFLKVVIPLALVVGIMVGLLPISGAKVLCVRLGCGLVVAMCLGFLLIIRDESRYSMNRMIVVSQFIMLGATPGVWILGIYSPAPIVLTLAIYFFGLGGDPRATFLLYVTAGLLQAVPAFVYAMGWLSDPGSIKAFGFDRTAQLIGIVMIQSVYATTYMLARGSRQATKSAIELLHRAMGQVEKRDALLAEAHLDLDRALKGGHKGRHSDKQLGPYVLGDVIGRGAMGEVYRGRAVDGGLVAVKVLHPEVMAEPAHVRRFLREAEIVASLHSSHVVEVRCVGMGDKSEAGANDLPFIAMELLDGHDLAWHLRRQRRLSPDRVVELVEQVAKALTAAVDAGVVHRDLKPQNIFLARISDSSGSRLWKVLDFGVSKMAAGSGTLTQGAVVGTPGYMAPEQAHGLDVGPPADVFALAAIAYRSLVGRPAFSGPDVPKVLFDVCYQQPQRPSELTPVSEDVERVLAIGMAKKPDERFQSARDLADALRAAVAGTLGEKLRNRADAILRVMPWQKKRELKIG